jgi:hypothetical protein
MASAAELTCQAVARAVLGEPVKPEGAELLLLEREGAASLAPGEVSRQPSQTSSRRSASSGARAEPLKTARTSELATVAESLSVNGSRGRGTHRWRGEFTVTLPASFWRRRDLSIEAKGYAALLVALADGRTWQLPQWCNPEKLQHFAGVSKKPRLRIERELRLAGILITDREGGRGRGLYRRLIYRLNLNVFSTVSK